MKIRSSTNSNADITRWLDSAGKYPRLPAHVVNIIGKQIQALPEDDPKRKKLVSKLVRHNLLLVVSFVKKFMDRKSHNYWGSPETLDYLQVGVVGLIRAAEKFDPARGYAFSTYAGFWMRSTVGRYNLKTITPVHVSESAARKLIYYKRNGCSSPRESSKPKTQAQLTSLINEVSLAYQCISLDVRPNYGQTYCDMIPDRETEQYLTMDDILSAIKASGVDEKGLEVLRLSFAEHKTVRQIGKIMGMPEEQVSQVRRYALERASKHPELFGVGIL